MAKTYCYFNLHKLVWSCMVRGIVQKHAEFVCIKDAEFVVRKAGHAKVIREKRKNVHAFVRGQDVTNVPFGGLATGEPVEISYNPYKGAHFYRKDTGEVVTKAALVELRADKKVYAWGVE